jgi:acyl carrier protein
MLNTPSVFINSSPIENQVIEMLSWQLHVDVSSIRPYTRFRDDLMMDAVDINLLIADLESRLNVYLSAEEIECIETIADAGRYFRAHLRSTAVL